MKEKDGSLAAGLPDRPGCFSKRVGMDFHMGLCVVVALGACKAWTSFLFLFCFIFYLITKTNKKEKVNLMESWQHQPHTHE